jgi:ketosteroid isomerase-like protein
MLQNLIIDPNLKITFAADRVQVAASGDLAYSRGHYTMQLTDKGTSKPVTSTGSYLTVYKKEADGSWKAVEDFITPGPAEPAETAAK